MRSLRAAGIALCCLAGLSAAAQSLDDLVLAVVNGEEIKRRDLIARLVEYEGEEVRERLVLRTILAQEAKKRGIVVTRDEEAAKLHEVRSRFKSDDAFKAFLDNSRLNEEKLLDDIRNSLLSQKVALQADPLREEELDQFDARIILAADRMTAQAWIKELEGGAAFRTLAAARNGDANLRKAEGRLAPFLKIEMLTVAQAIEDQKLKPLEFTRTPVELKPGTWAIIRLEQRIPAARGASAVERERMVSLVTTYKVNQYLEAARKAAKVQLHPLDQPVIATVGGEPIPRDRLVTRLLEFKGEEGLDRMVNRMVLLQAAKRDGVSLSEDEFRKRFDSLRAKFKTADDWQTFLEKAHTSEKQFRDEARYNFLLEMVALRESPVVDMDLVRYDVRMIICPDKPTAEKWIAELNDGGDFTRMALERTLDPQGRETAGRLRPFLKVELLDIWRLLQEHQLKPGGYTRTPALLTDGNWAILKLEGTMPPTNLTGEERDRLVAVVRDYRINQWLGQTRAAAKIAHPVPFGPAVIRPAGG